MAEMLRGKARHVCVSAALGLMVALWALLGLVNGQEQESELKEGFSITDIDESGEKKWEMIGESANFISETEIEMFDVRAFIYKKGKGDTLVTTDKAVFNRKTKVIHSDQFVTVVGKDMIITGIGLLWKPKEKKIMILSDVKMDISKGEEKYVP